MLPGPDIAGPAAAGLSRGPARALLAELAGAGLIAEENPGRYGFHDLLRGYAAELAQASDTAGRRHVALHRLLDHYLHSACAADRLLDPYRDPIAVPPVRPGVTVEEHAAHEAWRRAVAVLEELGHPDVDAVRAKLLGRVDTPQPS